MGAKKGKRPKIRRLAPDDDLNELFSSAQGTQSPDDAACVHAETFDTMLEETLSGIDHKEILRRKYPEPERPVPPKQRISPDAAPRAELDLHGCHVQEALVRVEAFIETSALQGLDAVSIIVGKGLHSQAGAVLPDAVEKKIVELKRRGRVATFAWGKKYKRASGSLVVYLG